MLKNDIRFIQEFSFIHIFRKNSTIFVSAMTLLIFSVEIMKLFFYE